MFSLTRRVFGCFIYFLLHFKLLANILKFGKVPMKIWTFSEKLANLIAINTHLALVGLELQWFSPLAAQ